MSDSEIPHWVLISVLFSSVPLSAPLALTLSQLARGLYKSKERIALVDTPLAKGELTSLEGGAAIGSISGPVFEANLETERGPTVVRFILTHQGQSLIDELEQEGGLPAPASKPVVWN